MGQRKNGRSGGKNQTAVLGLWAVLGGIPSGWEQFGAEKKWAVLIALLFFLLKDHGRTERANGHSRRGRMGLHGGKKGRRNMP